ncbi:flavin reductase family protein [Streptomyces tuirus]|uniref:Flavin reductase family protein n=1 Tax=Streptomyces tuirus TaxID=68278 RepID=A0A941J1F1_9ACTN|nr:flavin reductase family protein [Streptomyces tuirus]
MSPLASTPTDRTVLRQAFGCFPSGVTALCALHGSVYVHGAGLWLGCSVHAEVAGGDHTIVLLEIHGLRA